MEPGFCRRFQFFGDNEIVFSVNLKGKLHGELLIVNKKGVILVKQNFIDNKCHGKDIRFLDDGKSSGFIFWKNGKQFGHKRFVSK
jgi:antitoxin component YwqK of YwqJK toxin-antitoxin module